jgi:hypothetical protein
MKAVIGALILAAIPLSGLFIVTGRYSGAVSAHADLRIQTVPGLRRGRRISESACCGEG